MIYCSQCGEENRDENKFCSSCGQLIRVPSESATQPVSNIQSKPNDDRTVFAVLGWVFNAISILLIPILFAAGGVIFGYLHRKINKTHGTIIMIAGVACGLFGTILGMAVAAY